MSETVTAADANRQFSQILRKVRQGESYVVTSHGKPVAQIVPTSIAAAEIPAADIRAAKPGPAPIIASSVAAHEISVNNARRAARAFLLDRLRKQPVKNIGTWSREELYAR